MTVEKRVVRLFGVDIHISEFLLLEKDIVVVEKAMANPNPPPENDNNIVNELPLALIPLPEAASMVQDVLSPQESLPQNLREVVEQLSGERTNLVFLARKKLEGSDLKANLNRLFIPRTKAMVETLNKREKAVLGIEVEEKTKKRKREDDQENENENQKKKKVMNKREGVLVSVVDPSGRVYSKMKFKKWPSLDQPVLVTQWKNLVADNGLERDDTVEVYSFRDRDNKLCFALDVIRKGERN